LAFYSLKVNALGALTTSNIPPKVEADHLQVPIPHTYAYNQQLLNKNNQSSSLVYNLFTNVFTASQYYYLYLTAVSLVGLVLLLTDFYSHHDH
jgi:hypothetical protein